MKSKQSPKLSKTPGVWQTLDDSGCRYHCRTPSIFPTFTNTFQFSFSVGFFLLYRQKDVATPHNVAQSHAGTSLPSSQVIPAYIGEKVFPS